MKIKLLLFLCIFITPASGFTKSYIFFLHGMYLELYKESEPHPEYGRCEYSEILSAFRAKGFTVLSELRPKGTDARVYAEKIVKQVDSLMRRGVKPSDITVIGTSKGGYIAEYVSGMLKNKEMNFVFIGCCSDNVNDNPDVQYYGNILSIYEKSDQWHSCSAMRERSDKNVSRFKEIELDMGLKHGFLYKALKEWIEPAAQWAGKNYTGASK